MNLTGEWIGHYSGHFEQVIQINQDGPIIEAIKVTGDEFVPAGEVTWRVDLEKRLAQGRIAQSEFREPKFVDGRFRVIDQNRIEFDWLTHGKVEYRRDI